jgi:predicted HTH transcriptional regulator
VDVEESELEFDDNTRRLTIPQIGKARPERSGRQKSDPAMDRDKQDDVLNAIRGNPGITLNKLREIAGIRREDIPKVVAALRQLGLVSIKEGKNRAQHMFVSDRGWEGADDDCE